MRVFRRDCRPTTTGTSAHTHKHTRFENNTFSHTFSHIFIQTSHTNAMTAHNHRCIDEFAYVLPAGMSTMAYWVDVCVSVWTRRRICRRALFDSTRHGEEREAVEHVFVCVCVNLGGTSTELLLFRLGIFFYCFSF